MLRVAAKITDEEVHLHLFTNMWKTLRIELPHVFTDQLIAECRELIHLAAQHEIAWGKYIIQDGVLGLTDTIIEGFIQSLADKRLESIGLEILYGVKNPITWFDDASKINLGETNFFEGKNASYVAGGSLEWD